MYTYILESKENPSHHYTGSTLNLKQRLSDHNSGKCRHTSKFKPWKIIGAIWFSDPIKAVAFEKYLKSGSGRTFAKNHF
jgi:predicted GIY-YIG superfamily endonuclease